MGSGRPELLLSHPVVLWSPLSGPLGTEALGLCQLMPAKTAWLGQGWGHQVCQGGLEGGGAAQARTLERVPQHSPPFIRMSPLACIGLHVAPGVPALPKHLSRRWEAVLRVLEWTVVFLVWGAGLGFVVLKVLLGQSGG